MRLHVESQKHYWTTQKQPFFETPQALIKLGHIVWRTKFAPEGFYETCYDQLPITEIDLNLSPEDVIHKVLALA